MDKDNSTNLELTNELIKFLKNEGAKLVSIGNMQDVSNCEFPVGVVIAIPVPKNIVNDLKTEPTKEYYDMYADINKRLNFIVTKGAEFLKEKGYEALAQTTTYINDENGKVREAKVPHKTVATRSGLGWVGKNCLLVTEEYGSAIRLSSLLTDAPLKINEPINESKCGKCNVCVEKCPANVLSGSLWSVGVERKDIVDVKDCYVNQKKFKISPTVEKDNLCGKCFAVCTFTQKYLRAEV